MDFMYSVTQSNNISIFIHIETYITEMALAFIVYLIVLHLFMTQIPPNKNILHCEIAEC